MIHKLPSASDCWDTARAQTIWNWQSFTEHVNEIFHFSCCSCFCTLHCLDSMRKLSLWSSWLKWKSHLEGMQMSNLNIFIKNPPKDIFIIRNQCQETVFLPLLFLYPMWFQPGCASQGQPHGSQSRWERHNPHPLLWVRHAAVSHLWLLHLEWRSPCSGTLKSIRRWVGSSLCPHFPWSNADFWLNAEMQTPSLFHLLFEDT